MDQRPVGADSILAWFVRSDDWFRGGWRRRVAIGLPLGLCVYLLGVTGSWVAVGVLAVVVAALVLGMLWARHRLDAPAPLLRP